MTTSLTIGAVTITAAGAYLRWAIAPIRIAYQVGKRVERILATRRESRPLPAGDGYGLRVRRAGEAC
jgi:hypothetical protein